MPNWTQEDYRYLWRRVIERYARRVWLMEGWHYSDGCAFEFYVARREGIETLNEVGGMISRIQGISLIRGAMSEMAAMGLPTGFLRTVVSALEDVSCSGPKCALKDEALARLAVSSNVAQFVSFSPGDPPLQRYCRIRGVPEDSQFGAMEDVIRKLLETSLDNSVNVRSFRGDDASSSPFEYGLRSVADVVSHVKKLASRGLYTIVNETIDTNDGGVSGVLADEVVTFAPDDTPRCVETEGTAQLPVSVAGTILEKVYGFRPRLHFEPSLRVEFSIHPRRRGNRHDHTIVWEIGTLDEEWSMPRASGALQIGAWPNHFSRMLGDKVYGLLIADALGFPVPRTHVVNRRVAPFSFGRTTGSSEYWVRTSPNESEPGKYPTEFGWRDPFALMTEVDARICKENEERTRRCPPLPELAPLSSVVGQESVAAAASGSLITRETGPVMEGVRGFGDAFMIGGQEDENLPDGVRKAVLEIQRQLKELIGPVSFEWAYDGRIVWIIQLHMELSPGFGEVLVPGEAVDWLRFEVSEGLERLRQLADTAAQRGDGIELDQRVAATSHAAAILRKKGVPTRVKRRDA